MTSAEFTGLALLGVSAFHLIPAVLTGKIPSKWPVYPLTREAKPTEFRITFGVFLAAGMVGVAILLAALARRIGL
jgi:hypothetical protein